MDFSVRERLGALAIDWPRFEWALRTNWLKVHNRNESLQASPDGLGFACRWQWTTDVHVAKVFPTLGARLMKTAVKEWPFGFAKNIGGPAGDVDVSFVIGHRGMNRVPQLLATLASIAAQRGPSCECVVVEQSEARELCGRLPSWVTHVYTPPLVPVMPYSRAWAFNVGVKHSRGRVVVLHDNDLLIPMDYAGEILRRVDEGFDAVNVKRFIFYLREEHSRRLIAGKSDLAAIAPESIMQNAEAGGSIAITRTAFDRIGGLDESFVGWGGEDNEFWERAQTLQVWPYGYLPLVHLWHAAQPEKLQSQRPAVDHFRRRSAIPVEQRIAELRARDFGNPERMDPPWPSAATGG